MKKNKEKEPIEVDDFISKKKEKILNELDDLESESTFIISSNRPKSEQEEKQKKEKEEMEREAGDEWLATISSFRTEPIKRSSRKRTSIFDFYDDGTGKKKKKKKKKENEPTDYNKEFEKELNLFTNLLMDQNTFVDSLQKRYNAMEHTKSSQQGIGKFQADLINAINSGRSVSSQLINQIVSMKKNIADLTLKEKKELALKTTDNVDIGAFSSQFLKEMLNTGRENILNGGDIEVVDNYTEEDIYEALSNSIDDDYKNNEEIDKYLQYEQEGVTIYIIENTATSDIRFEARRPDGSIVDDYPLPKVEGININRSTNVATDKYGRKFDVIYE